MHALILSANDSVELFEQGQSVLIELFLVDLNGGSQGRFPTVNQTSLRFELGRFNRVSLRARSNAKYL